MLVVPPDRIATDEGARLDQSVEALIFASDTPLQADDIAQLLGEVTGRVTEAGEVERAVERLNASYRETHRAFRVERWGGGYRLATIPEQAGTVKALFAKEDEQRLSRSLLETVAVIAYKQPVTKPEIEHVRGVSADYALRQLLERGFVEIAGRAEAIGRPLLYATTDRFLDQFGLESLDHLPTPREVEEILADPRFSRDRAQLLAEWAAENQPTPEAVDSSEPVDTRLRVVVSSDSPDPAAAPPRDAADG
ncbi:MAG: SMC-Scp complex subunit ScpB [Bacteroidota bacterium]